MTDQVDSDRPNRRVYELSQWAGEPAIGFRAHPKSFFEIIAKCGTREHGQTVFEALTASTALADGLHARGIIPGRNPDGINDDVEKALTLIDDYKAENERLRDALREIASPDCMVKSGHPDGGCWIDTEAPARIAENALDRSVANDERQADA